jgi:acyl-CoA thioesterase FadM
MSVRRYAELAERAALAAGAGIGQARANMNAFDRASAGYEGSHSAVAVSSSGENPQEEAERDWPAVGRGAIVSIREVVTRQHREQFLGTDLIVLLGIVSITEYSITLHIEIRSRHELASTHLITVAVVDPDRRTPLPLPPHSFEMLQRVTDEALVGEQPEYGRPRRLTTAPMRQPTLDEVAAHDVELWSDRIVEPAECDFDGWFAGGPAQLAWGRADQPRPPTRWQFPDADGHPYALTNVEHRRVVFSTPRVGAHLKTLAANLAIEKNRRVRREWTFDVNTGTLHAMGEFVDLVIDLTARRAAETPDHVRRALTDHLHPELGDAPHDVDSALPNLELGGSLPTPADIRPTGQPRRESIDSLPDHEDLQQR